VAKHVDDFIAELGAENEAFFSCLPEGSTSYWSGRLEGPAAAAALKPRWFNELRGVEVIGRFIERVPDITLKVMLGKQVGDEAKHARVCRRRIEELGSSVLDYIPSPESLAFGDLLDSLAYPEEFFAAQQFTVETQSLKRNELALSCFDSATALMFKKYINPDERFHVRLGHLGLKVFARTEAAQRRARDAARKVRQIHVKMVKAHRSGKGLLDR
jgi:1,2-phenylacetyl-CoA epoxidase catalytic subunit